MAKRKNYIGADLPTSYKSFARKEIKRIEKILTERGCTNFDFSYGFYYFSGFFTAPNGQVFYLNSMDKRTNGSTYYYRTAKDYKDYTGGTNRWINPDEIEKIDLN